MSNTGRIHYPSPNQSADKKSLHRLKRRRRPICFENDGQSSIRGEISLWRAVIMQALVDAASGSAKAEMRHERNEALRWLRGTNKDFTTVCHLAGFDPAYVRRKAQDALQRGCRWRAEPLAKIHPHPLPRELRLKKDVTPAVLMVHQSYRRPYPLLMLSTYRIG